MNTFSISNLIPKHSFFFFFNVIAYDLISHFTFLFKDKFGVLAMWLKVVQFQVSLRR